MSSLQSIEMSEQKLGEMLTKAIYGDIAKTVTMRIISNIEKEVSEEIKRVQDNIREQVQEVCNNWAKVTSRIYENIRPEDGTRVINVVVNFEQKRSQP